MTTAEAISLLEKFRAGKIGRAQVLHAFQAAPLAELGFAQVDLHRSLRKNFPEVIYGENKTPQQVVEIAVRISKHEQRLLVTRVTLAHARALRRKLRRAVFHETARCVTYEKQPLPKRPGVVPNA